MLKRIKKLMRKTVLAQAYLLAFVILFSPSIREISSQASTGSGVITTPAIISDSDVVMDASGIMKEQIIISPVIPTDTESSRTEVLEEVRRQEALEKEIKDIIAEEIRIARRKEYVKSIVCDPSDVSRVSGLKRSDYKLLTKGTWWEGHEEALYDLENTYGINAMFAMSVSTIESYFGKSARAKSRNNYYGLELSTVWSGLYSNTQSWGKILRNYYVEEGRKSVGSISTKYCPPNSEYWAEFNSNNMYKLYNSLINKLEDTIE